MKLLYKLKKLFVMAEFTGNLEEFTKYIGGFTRNKVQNITKTYRKNIGRCENEDCKSKKNLEAAHIHGKDRKTLIFRILNTHIVNDTIYKIDLVKFENEFKEAHYPLDSTFKILCKSCHHKYDNSIEVIEDINENETNLYTADNDESSVLPIELYPKNVSDFKKLLIKHKYALIHINYENGEIVTKGWKATKFNNDSDVIRNLRSRIEFRQGNWQKINIKKIEVVINDLIK